MKDRIQAALGRARERGIGCQFWLEPEFNLSLGVLVQAGLVSPIRQRVPPCHEHGCHLLGRCPEEQRFQRSEDADRPEGIAGKKFKLTERGNNLVDNAGDPWDFLRNAIAESPLCVAVLQIMAEKGPQGVGSLEMVAQLIRLHHQCLEKGQDPPFALDRWQLGQWLSLMEGAGLIRSDQGFRWFYPGPALAKVNLRSVPEAGPDAR